MKIQKIVSGIVLSVLMCLFFGLHAQTSPPPTPATSGPIDSGAIFLLLGVALLAYFNIKRFENKKPA